MQRGDFFSDANGEDLSGPGTDAREEITVYFRTDRSNDRRRHGQFCDARATSILPNRVR